MNRQSHCPRTCNQNNRIDRTHAPVQVTCAFRKRIAVKSVINKVANKKSTEHQDLGDHEQPDAFFRSLEFVVGITEVMRVVVFVISWCVIIGTHKAPL